MKALLHLKDGKNDTVELLIHISEQMGDIKEFVNLAYTSTYYKGKLHETGIKHHYFICLSLKYCKHTFLICFYAVAGQTALHIAIERRSISYVKLLVSKGADVHAKACGKFFQPHNGPNFYFGESTDQMSHILALYSQ